MRSRQARHQGCDYAVSGGGVLSCPGTRHLCVSPRRRLLPTICPCPPRQALPFLELIYKGLLTCAEGCIGKRLLKSIYYIIPVYHSPRPHSAIPVYGPTGPFLLFPFSSSPTRAACSGTPTRYSITSSDTLAFVLSSCAFMPGAPVVCARKRRTGERGLSAVTHQTQRQHQDPQTVAPPHTGPVHP